MIQGSYPTSSLIAMHSGLFLLFFERCRGLDRLQYSATITDTSRVGAARLILPLLLLILLQQGEEGTAVELVGELVDCSVSFMDDCKWLRTDPCVGH